MTDEPISNMRLGDTVMCDNIYVGHILSIDRISEEEVYFVIAHQDVRNRHNFVKGGREDILHGSFDENQRQNVWHIKKDFWRYVGVLGNL